MPRTEKYITIYGLFTDVILDLFKKSFDVFTKRGKDRSFQVSPAENEFSCSAILLLLAGLESYYSRLENFILVDKIYPDKFKPLLSPARCKKCGIKKYPQKSDIIADVVKEELKNSSLYSSLVVDTMIIKKAIDEISTVRNAIAHNHLYSVEVEYDDDFTIKSWKYKSLKADFQGEAKLTEILKINTIPIQIGFPDLMKTLLVMDFILNVLANLYPKYFFARFIGAERVHGEFIQYPKTLFGIYLDKMKEMTQGNEAGDIIKSIFILEEKFIQFEPKVKKDLLTLAKAEIEKANLLENSILDDVSPCQKCSFPKNSFFYEKSDHVKICYNCSYDPRSMIRVSTRAYNPS